MKKLDLTGLKFQRLMVVRELPIRKNRRVVWECRCDCGNVRNVTTLRLRTGHTISCGCFQKEKALENLIASDGSHVKRPRIYARALFNKQRKDTRHDWNLSFEDFKRLIEGNCSYCGSSPRYDCDGILRNGIDRIDSKIGYSIENCKSCCKICNFMKRDLSVQEFLSHCELILSFVRSVNA